MENIEQIKAAAERVDYENKLLTEQLETANQKIRIYELERLKLKVAQDQGLPLDFMPLMQGDDEPTLAIHARELKAIFCV